MNRTTLVNKLNYLNFQEQTISVHLKHLKYNNTIALQVKPLPCAGERLDCSWINVPGLQQVLTTYRFGHLLLNDGQTFVMVAPKLIKMDEEGLSVLLPMKGREYRVRRIKRHACSGIGVQLTQDGVLFQGTLADFTPVSLRVEGKVGSPQTFKWLNPECPVTVHLYLGKHILYSGPCGILRHSYQEQNGTFVLQLLESCIKRFNLGRYSSQAQQLVPSPNIIFEHPLIKKTINLKVADLSGCTMSVEENEENSVLMAGMVIPSLRLTFGHALNFTCRAQVVSRTTYDDDGEGVARCTLVILDMGIHDHVKLLSLLQQVDNANSYLCSSMDMDALWDFFFDTGFIYAQKYAHFEANKSVIKKTYQKLYGNNPHIARHFTYQEKGVILGHMAMVRFFENAWMIHHHAARKKVSLKAGMSVLEQISHYLNVLRHFYFAHLNYVYCFFRPDNKFPNRVFGGLARQVNNQKACSLDKFSYSFFKKSEKVGTLQGAWTLKDTCAFDLSELATFYSHSSGGRMIEAFDLRPDKLGADTLAEDYQRLGFKKEKRIYSLYQEGILRAVIVSHATDAGFNMADLTNCVTVFVLEESVPAEILQQALGEVSCHYEADEVPVLTYPYSYVETSGFPSEKVYMLWILDLRYIDAYFEYTDALFRGARRAEAAPSEDASEDGSGR